MSAFDYAVKLLGYRARTEKELRERLRDKSYEPEAVEKALQRLAAVGLIDDDKFAESFVHSRLSIMRRGKYRICLEMKRRGFSRELTEKWTSQISADDEIEVARELLESRIRSWSNLDELTRKRRALGLLGRRGFAPNIIYRLLKEIQTS
ncbi:hypothetical protein A3A71_00275 [Candidatus Berkelbacteria bacterium RIFCSPLOWO2_01_FULL_50_28]|uniref:Regulatory protein RecX n=1 Tax=Candidatus Berkelbacteria bacterium RIFCSPLOWO2_01_FULL_50_28 TaxID=1797471 RepID=A0A1F5EAR7_9BACT|nr:MAG: hypothetical protein A2807_00205 [Candidatus Berkelbacteria bacterium RIFCSPHIGHO2_01_FULL_50_36]OGD62829.1 MAG: hypothetical protein A3F39_02280 [Candidatus Berkelbacteria bacterium RIFCSPHIGHO2_12_FULL_50_11]OGD64485.1 MAG: hypothetical protein A3A71_00275 [Candidatus Berkelbacteria bacterium RIFCSPLOWO2_01_FULL_50_28]